MKFLQKISTKVICMPFLEVEEFIFGSDDQLVVDPSSEKLKNEFKKVKKSFIPINSIQRIDEVDKHGEASKSKKV